MRFDSEKEKSEMYRMKLGIGILLAIFFLAAASYASAAKQEECHHGHRFHGRNPMFRLMHRLNLTADQKSKVAAILKQEEPDIKTAAQQMVEARKQLFTAVMSANYDAKAVSAASQQVANAAEQLAQIRAKIVSQTVPILTPEQQTTFKNMVAKVSSRMGTHLDARFEHLDKWIARHGG